MARHKLCVALLLMLGFVLSEASASMYWTEEAVKSVLKKAQQTEGLRWANSLSEDDINQFAKRASEQITGLSFDEIHPIYQLIGVLAATPVLGDENPYVSLAECLMGTYKAGRQHLLTEVTGFAWGGDKQANADEMQIFYALDRLSTEKSMETSFFLELVPGLRHTGLQAIYINIFSFNIASLMGIQPPDQEKKWYWWKMGFVGSNLLDGPDNIYQDFAIAGSACSSHPHAQKFFDKNHGTFGDKLMKRSDLEGMTALFQQYDNCQTLFLSRPEGHSLCRRGIQYLGNDLLWLYLDSDRLKGEKTGSLKICISDCMHQTNGTDLNNKMTIILNELVRRAKTLLAPRIAGQGQNVPPGTSEMLDILDVYHEAWIKAIGKSSVNTLNLLLEHFKTIFHIGCKFNKYSGNSYLTMSEMYKENNERNFFLFFLYDAARAVLHKSSSAPPLDLGALIDGALPLNTPLEVQEILDSLSIFKELLRIANTDNIGTTECRVYNHNFVSFILERLVNASGNEKLVAQYMAVLTGFKDPNLLNPGSALLTGTNHTPYSWKDRESISVVLDTFAKGGIKEIQSPETVKQISRLVGARGGSLDILYTHSS